MIRITLAVALIALFPVFAFPENNEACFIDELIECKKDVLTVRQELEESLNAQAKLLKQIPQWRWVEFYLRGGVLLWYKPISFYPYAIVGVQLNLTKLFSIHLDSGYPFSAVYGEVRF